MKIYFSASVFYEEQCGKRYKTIVDALGESGCKVFEGISNVSFDSVTKKSDEEQAAYYKQVIKWIDRSDAMVVEASFPSTLNVGHEMTLAIEKSRPVAVLYEKGKRPMFGSGLANDRVKWYEYTEETLSSVVKKAVEEIKTIIDVRFNFFVNPAVMAFLNEKAKERKIPVSVWLRELIDKEMKKEEKEVE